MSASIARHPVAALRNRSIKSRRAARQAKFERERAIVDYLNRGLSVVEIAARIGLTEKRMRAIVKEILARRMPEAPAEFVALQVCRLNEALLVAYGAMSGANLRAVECVVKIVRELDRYHGLAAAGQRPFREPHRLAGDPPATLPLASAGPETAAEVCEGALLSESLSREPPRPLAAAPSEQDRRQPSEVLNNCIKFDIQYIENTHLSLDRAGNGLHTDQESGQPAKRPNLAPQAPEKAQNAPGNGADAALAARHEAYAPGGEAAEETVAEPLSTNRIQTMPQPYEEPMFSVGTFIQVAAPFDNPGAVRRVMVRALLNGVAAC